MFVSATKKLSLTIVTLPAVTMSHTYADTGDTSTNWDYVAVSVTMNSDAVTSTVRVIKGVTNTEVDTTPDNHTHFTDLATGGSAFIGRNRDASKAS